MVEMQYVDSSNIEQIGYDPATLELYVYFLNGGKYVYDGVDAAVFESLMMAPSKGSYFNREIVKRYSFRKL